LPRWKEDLGLKGITRGSGDEFVIWRPWVAGAGGGGVEACCRGSEESVEVLRYAVIYGGAGNSKEICSGISFNGTNGEKRAEWGFDVPFKTVVLKQNWGVSSG